MALSRSEIEIIIGKDDDMINRMIELQANPYLLNQLTVGCCSFAAVNMIVLRYGNNDCTKRYMKKIHDIVRKHGGDFYSAAMERFKDFHIDADAKKLYGTNINEKKFKMDYFLNLGLITIFKRECKIKNSKILDENVRYSDAFGTYHTDKFRVIKANIQQGDFYIKKGDMANCWNGLCFALQLAVEAGGKQVSCTTISVIDQYLNKTMTSRANLKLSDFIGPTYKKIADDATESARDWARAWITGGESRFLIGGVLVNDSRAPRLFNSTKDWDHVTHYVVIPRAANWWRSTDFIATYGEKKAWDSPSQKPGEHYFVPIKILKIAIK